MEGNLRFKIDWASLIVGSKSIFDYHFLYLRAISKYKSLGGLYLEGLYMEGVIFGIWRC